MAVVHYVDNKKLFSTIVAYQKKVASAKAKGRAVPAIPEYIGECLLEIAKRLSSKANFANYTFRDDMISDAVENCLLYMHNFSPDKSQNPFAYFTQITHYAFIRRIEREKRYVYTKYKYALHQAHRKEDHVVAPGESYDIKLPAWTAYENIHEFVRGFEEKMSRPRPRTVDGDDGAGGDGFDYLDLVVEEVANSAVVPELMPDDNLDSPDDSSDESIDEE